MADIVNIKTRKIWVTCGHTYGGACAGCIRRDLLNPYEQLEKAVKRLRMVLRRHGYDDEQIDTWTQVLEGGSDE